MPATTNPGQVQLFSHGTGGTVRLGALPIGTLGDWRVIYSPTTGLPTLQGDGRFLRYWRQGVGERVSVELTPAPIPYRIGRKRPARPRPFILSGELVRLTATGITIASGSIARG